MQVRSTAVLVSLGCHFGYFVKLINNGAMTLMLHQLYKSSTGSSFCRTIFDPGQLLSCGIRRNSRPAQRISYILLLSFLFVC